MDSSSRKPGFSDALSNVRIVLVKPIYGGNIGAVARVMKNMGLRDLALVTPRPDVDWNEARRRAYRALDVLENARRFPSLEEAVGDCGLVAGTTARGGLYREHARTPREWAPRLLEAALDTAVALVFGPEDRGLTNEEIAECTQVIQIPSSHDYPSLNLSHAVMVCCYELFVASGTFCPRQERSAEAPSHLRERMFAMWRSALLEIGFVNEEKADHMMMGLRRILSRGPLTVADVKILMGIARQAQWCGATVRSRGIDPHVHPAERGGVRSSGGG
ncbi:MAG TPA: RNA methyltransferase [Kiritimatiellae bacterium]|nr:RNA methyltransferase [Kiritimatiellia bacterium]